MAFTFSLTPGDILNSNDRSLHWGAKARRAKALRQRAAIAWRLAGSPQMSRARLLVTVTYPTGHRRDVANLQATLNTTLQRAAGFDTFGYNCGCCGRPSAFINDQGRCTRPACREAKT